MTSQVSPFIMTNVGPGMHNFVVGQPSEALIPRTLIDKAIARVLAGNTDPFIYQYGAVRGPAPVLEQLAQFLSQSGRYSTTLTASNLCLTFGNSKGIATIVQALTTPGDYVIVEAPTYFLIGKILEDLHVNVIQCPVEWDSGLDMDAFGDLVARFRPKLVYVNPIHHNPTGTCLPVRKREELIKLSLQYGFFLVSDEPYTLLSFESPSSTNECHSSLEVTACRIFPNPDDYKYLVCCGSFSKILTPGLRCGWMSSHAHTISRIASSGALQSGGGPPALIAETIRQLIECGELTEHINFLRSELETRAIAMMSALTREFGDAIQAHVPSGGYFVFVVFSDPQMDTSELHAYISQHAGGKVNFLSGLDCCVIRSCEHTARAKRAMRLSFSFYSPAEIAHGISLLANAYKQWVSLRDSNTIHH